MVSINNNFRPLVSVALATYNGERFLREQLGSLLAQTYQNIEVVISDDGSTDNTKTILEEYMNQDARIRWSKNQKEKGFVINFGEAIQACRGEVVFLCDQDDFWYPEKIAKHMAVYQDSSIYWVHNELSITDESRRHVGYLTDTMPDYWTRRNLLYYTWGSCVLGCVTSYRRELISKIWPADTHAPGHDSWIQLVIYPAKAGHVAEVLQDYRQHADNVVGLKSVPSALQAELESRAIQNNLTYILSLVMNKRLQVWKRTYLLFVYTGKIFRSSLRRLL